jgi:tetratricopeptide (TPR) repeat protein
MRVWLGQNRSMDQVRDELEEVDPIVSRLLEIGQEYHDGGEYEQAIEAYQQALEASPHNIEARLGLGVSQLAQGDYGEAANVFEAVLELSPEDVAAQAGYCDAYMALGDFEFAFNRLEEAEFVFQKVLTVERCRQLWEASRQRFLNWRRPSALRLKINYSLILSMS